MADAEARPGGSTPQDFARTRPQRNSEETDAFLRAVVKSGASDLHLKCGRSPRVRIGGVLRKVEREPRPTEDFEAAVFNFMNDEQRAQLLYEGSVDLAYELEDGIRFRVNVFQQESGLSVAARLISREILSFEQLNLPPVVERIADNRQGLVLIAGITGSGKSTTLASMIEHINATRHEHIVTIEDPIEYLFTENKCLINQREVGQNVKDFTTALRALVREDPDVVLIGEMRDYETIRAALQAAETGHLVFGTIHASSAAQAIGRILDLFPEGERDSIRQSLVFNLRSIVVQKLLRSSDENMSRVPAVEVMINTPIVRKLIEEGRDLDIVEVIKGGEDGMQSFTDSLYDLYDKNLIDAEAARAAAPNVAEFEMRLKGIRTAAGRIIT
jgi:twitching motility protein PilT